MHVSLMNLLILALLLSAGCRKETEKPDKPAAPGATQPSGDASGGTIRERALNSGAQVTGGVFNDSPTSQPTTRP